MEERTETSLKAAANLCADFYKDYIYENFRGHGAYSQQITQETSRIGNCVFLARLFMANLLPKLITAHNNDLAVSIIEFHKFKIVYTWKGNSVSMVKQDVENGSLPIYNHVMVFYEDSHILELAGSFTSVQQMTENHTFLDETGTNYRIARFSNYWEILKDNKPYFLIQTEDVMLSHGSKNNLSNIFVETLDNRGSPKAYSLRHSTGTLRFALMFLPQQNNSYKITFYYSYSPQDRFQTKTFTKNVEKSYITIGSNEGKRLGFIDNLKKEITALPIENSEIDTLVRFLNDHVFGIYIFC